MGGVYWIGCTKKVGGIERRVQHLKCIEYMLARVVGID